jgi:hypothetical protein
VKELDPTSRLYVPTTLRLKPEDLAKTDAIRKDLAAILKQRRRHQVAVCGKDMASKRRQQFNAMEQERLRLEREKEVQEHIAQHDGMLLAYRIAFDKVGWLFI